MEYNDWQYWNKYSTDELEAVIERLERQANAYYREGNYDMGHGYYLLLCQAGICLECKIHGYDI